MILEIPLVATANQTCSVQIGGQSCRITVYQKATGLYLDLAVSDRPIITGVLCEDRNRLVRSVYLGFTGDLYFIDTQGAADPSYAGLGGRWRLVYVA